VSYVLKLQSWCPYDIAHLVNALSLHLFDHAMPSVSADLDSYVLTHPWIMLETCFYRLEHLENEGVKIKQLAFKRCLYVFALESTKGLSKWISLRCGADISEVGHDLISSFDCN
jgi:hypothetical protein